MRVRMAAVALAGPAILAVSAGRPSPAAATWTVHPGGNVTSAGRAS
jgi:hypothetical protein